MNALRRKPVGQEWRAAVPLPSEPGANRPWWVCIPSRSERAYGNLGQLIRSGMLRAGDALPPERLLARVFSIARGSMRMALGRLKCDGVLRICHGKSTIVTGVPLLRSTPFGLAPAVPSTHWAQDVVVRARRFALDLGLDAETCRVDPAVAQRLGSLAEMQHAAQGLPHFVIADRQFHAELRACCDARELAPLLSLADVLMHSALRDVFESQTVRTDVVKQHRTICRAVERRDLGSAVIALCDQLEMRIAAQSEKESETLGCGHATSHGSAAADSPLQDLMKTWRRCANPS